MKRIHSDPNGNFSEQITGREREILALIADYRSNKEIAASLHLALSTVKWYVQQIFGKLEVQSRREAVQRALELGLLGGNHEKAIQNNLPAAMTSFVGREEEVATVIRLLTIGESRLVTLQGLGGSGKTRLALEAASRLLKSENNVFSDGVWFVSLTPSQDIHSILQAIASAVGFSFLDRETEPLRQLLDYLRQRQLLLILDNFEHLISAESNNLLTEILAHAPRVKILVTSRARLSIQSEQLFPVTGMDTPNGENTIEKNWAGYSAIQLFNQCARRVHPKFEINAENSPSVIRICQLVEGLPLAIEMAAAWLELLSPYEIAAEIRRSLDFLKTDQTDIPKRQQSIRAVFDSSWNLLSEEEQGAYLRLCVIVGHFSREAAQQVSGAPLRTLLGLAHKSWMQQVENGRFQLHELMRQYGEERLQADPKACEEAKNLHARYFSGFVAEQSLKMRGPAQLAGLSAIREEFDTNIKAAWDCLIVLNRWEEMVEKMALGLYQFATIYVRTADLLPWVRNARVKIELETGITEPLAIAILGTLEVYCEEEAAIKDYNPLERLKKLWQFVKNHDLAEAMGFWYVLLTGLVHAKNLDSDAKARLGDAIACIRERGDPWMLGISLMIQANWWLIFSLDENKLLEAAQIFENLGVLYEQGYVAGMLADHGVQHRRAPAEIKRYVQRSNQFYKKMGDLYPLLANHHSSGTDYFAIGEIENGFAALHEQQEFYEQSGHFGLLAGSLNWESQFAVWYSTFDHALRTRQRCLELAEKSGFQSFISWALYEYGEVYRVFGDQEKALDLYEQARVGFEEKNITLGLGYYHRAYGDIALRNPRYSEALAHYQKYKKYAHRDNHLWSMAQARAKLALAHAYLGELGQSRQELHTALTEMRAWGKDDLTLQTLLAEPVCLLQEGRYEEAVEFCAFLLNHRVSWNETRHQARVVLDAASRQLSSHVVELTKGRGKAILLEDALRRYPATEQVK